MKTEQKIGISLIVGAIGVLLPYTILTIIFDYPDILRQDTGVILTKYHEKGSNLIWTWWAFAILGLPAVLILFTTREISYVGWMFVYLLSLPIWN